MNSIEAKKIPIQNFLLARGYKPSSTTSKELWYHSPLRENDKTPSFKVNLLINTWYDFSIGKGGTIIDLSSLIYNEDVSDTLKRLSNDYGSLIKLNPVVQFRSKAKITESTFELQSVSKLKNPRLIEYLKNRRIHIPFAQKYLKEIYFITSKTKNLNFALAIENELQGFEFRNIFMKGSINGKSFTLINPGEGKDIAIFEGFIDFLSFLTDHKIDDFQSTVLILNSVNLRNETLKVFEEHQYKKAYCFLDNDKAGQETYDFFSKNLSIPLTNKASIYKDYVDYNEYLQHKTL